MVEGGSEMGTEQKFFFPKIYLFGRLKNMEGGIERSSLDWSFGNSQFGARPKPGALNCASTPTWMAGALCPSFPALPGALWEAVSEVEHVGLQPELRYGLQASQATT